MVKVLFITVITFVGAWIALESAKALTLF